MNHIRRLRAAALLVLALTAFSSIHAMSQEINPAEDASKARADFAVADAPAFKVLDTIPGPIVRPTTAREVAVTLSNLLNTSGVLPKAFALELSPYQLLVGKSLSAYRNDPVFYRIKISAGMLDHPDGSKDFGWGVRATLVDKADLRLNSSYMEELKKVGFQISDASNEATKILPDSLMFSDPKEYEKRRKQLIKEILASADDNIVKMRDSVKETNWNAEVIEGAIAGKAGSIDSVANNLMETAYSFWGMAAFPIMGSDGQILFGINGSCRRNDDQVFVGQDFSFGARLYFGRNDYKGFFESDWQTTRERLPQLGLSVGGELNIANGIWVDCSLGFQKKSGNDATLTSSINLRLATPESK